MLLILIENDILRSEGGGTKSNEFLGSLFGLGERGSSECLCTKILSRIGRVCLIVGSNVECTEIINLCDQIFVLDDDVLLNIVEGYLHVSKVRCLVVLTLTSQYISIIITSITSD